MNESEKQPTLQLPTTVQAAENEDLIVESLREVYDPELGMSIVDLGLVYGIETQGDEVNVRMTFTSMGCPMGPQIVEDVKQAIQSIGGISDVSVDIVWSPAWNPSMMSEDAKLELGYL